MKLRVGKELTELMQWASANTGYSMSKIVTITLRCHAKQPFNMANVDDPGGGVGGTVITISPPSCQPRPRGLASGAAGLRVLGGDPALAVSAPPCGAQHCEYGFFCRMDQPTLRRLLWIKLSQERTRDKKKPLPKDTAVENKDYVLVDDVSNLNLSKQQIEAILDHLYSDK